jgi:RNA polymerase sigma-70 factor (ECF subfamily)
MDQPTSLSLLDDAQRDTESQSWNRLFQLYTPLLKNWLRRYSLNDQDIEDLTQEVLSVVARELSGFQHNQRTGAFRAWLRTILVHRLRDFQRRQQRRPIGTGDSGFAEQLDQLQDPSSPLSQVWDQEHDRHLAVQLLRLAKAKFAPKTWRAFYMLVFEELGAADVATKLGMSLNAVFIAKSRVLSHLRQEGKALIT